MKHIETDGHRQRDPNKILGIIDVKRTSQYCFIIKLEPHVFQKVCDIFTRINLYTASH